MYPHTPQLSQQYHPDLNKEPGAREKFQKVSEAWAVLKDGRERREYDRRLRQMDGPSSSNMAGGRPWASYDNSTEWSSHSRRHTRQSAQWAWSSSSSRPSPGGPGSGSKRPHRASDPFSNPHVQRATGKTRSQESSSSYSSGSWFSGSDPYSGYWGGPRRKSSASARAEEEHAREAEVNSQSGLWSAFPTIGVTLLFLMLAHGWGAKA